MINIDDAPTASSSSIMRPSTSEEGILTKRTTTSAALRSLTVTKREGKAATKEILSSLKSSVQKKRLLSESPDGMKSTLSMMSDVSTNLEPLIIKTVTEAYPSLKKTNEKLKITNTFNVGIGPRVILPLAEKRTPGKGGLGLIEMTRNDEKMIAEMIEDPNQEYQKILF